MFGPQGAHEDYLARQKLQPFDGSDEMLAALRGCMSGLFYMEFEKAVRVAQGKNLPLPDPENISTWEELLHLS